MKLKTPYKTVMSQSLWVRDRFLIVYYVQYVKHLSSQSLWVRDRFLIYANYLGLAISHVAIPLGQGQVFNAHHAIAPLRWIVAIPLGQGQVFNLRLRRGAVPDHSRNPFGSGTGF